jgi:protein O-GlcNAc transferase
LAGAYNNKGNAHLAEGNHSAAIASLEKVIALEPDHARAHNNLGNALLDAGQADQATVAYTKSLELSPGQPRVHSNLIYCSQYDPNITAETLIARHIEWDQAHGALLKGSWENHANAPREKTKNKQPLRIGFVSADLGKHPVGYFLISLLENLSAKEFTITCYSDRAQEDELSDRIRSASHKWVKCVGNTDDRLASKIRSDSIDMLFELSGHTKANRLSLFAHKPAPVQITWGIGYPGLTGMTAVDVILTDQHHITAAEEALFNEQVAIMPQGVSSYEPPHYAPDIGPLPFDENTFITFGSFNQTRKVNASVIGVWVEILKAVPNSKLLVKYIGMDSDINRRRIEAGLKAGGINPARVTCEGGAPHAEFLASYNKVDIVLDTFPYSGGMTTCEALWMGAPVITYPGATIASRHATSHLSGVGLPDLIATDKTGYIKIATKLAANTQYLRELRASLRTQMANSPLCDGPASAQDFTALIKEIWAERCQGDRRV